ncbi:phosphoribosylanthranilate isomerase [Actinobaculum suis]|uniref:1-(5-phosphoribosyl)-5-[(5-phosphoribosylamino)methylideneamino] imidazole-4-carboxamide isomerase n=1 Tax=Actinobaculum suis TaxID=1657 RepID=A0A0K9EU91_9ACTO|nr:HisA/HisF-related TIM barrel protein [Actinobaculum suis]KMY23421.1 phosphoribosyl isomerase [Actinobaculum suis]MDY5153166.1 HisA/HisF-related TIM barrel protein [Actinobaculum suis]OCA93807.1 bifunctional 1-(5-phosphoribosyl)-5-((5-phosphoribosylamino)methylideneamino)imidazole-4-carboxamide isomerase/phosphoribosylanthranilate isomerase PriA [Actinobaculum suis]OCA94100.1 bifunctional 1-(5-phosphoribosyl)-5-((5-phosphoribosylamino)methylideneamino)imidazole-4-carboxamide isomerase/phospho
MNRNPSEKNPVAQTAAAGLQLLPAVDVENGQSVRLRQGQAGSEENYGDPRQAVEEFIAAGANYIHLVDLDAAFQRGNNAELLAQIIGQVPVDIQISGGIATRAALDAALATGARRAVISAAALAEPEWVEEAIAEYGDRIAVGIDVRGEEIIARGSQVPAGNMWRMLERLEAAGCARYVVTDVDRDGMLTGPDLELLRKVGKATRGKIIASGGVRSLADIVSLRELGAYGVDSAIIGKAFYAGNFSFAAALEAAGPQG